MLFSAFGDSHERSANSESEDTRKRILIVESDVDTADRIGSLLEDLGYNTGMASDAKTALLLLTDFAPNLVLLGTYLSDMPGYELTQILRGAPQYSYHFRHVGLLYVADRHKLLKHRLIGAPEVPLTQYVFKPINPDELRDKVARALLDSIA